MYVTPCSYAKDLRNFCDPDSYDNQSSIRKHAESRSAAPVGGVGGGDKPTTNSFKPNG